jgi:hypothetical protein
MPLFAQTTNRTVTFNRLDTAGSSPAENTAISRKEYKHLKKNLHFSSNLVKTYSFL